MISKGRSEGFSEDIATKLVAMILRKHDVGARPVVISSVVEGA